MSGNINIPISITVFETPEFAEIAKSYQEHSEKQLLEFYDKFEIKDSEGVVIGYKYQLKRRGKYGRISS